MTIIDLHIHSTYSNDGEFTPAQLVDLCLQAGLTHAAIADHNSVKGVNEAIRASKNTPLEIIPAIEMNCVFDGIELHLLGYGVDPCASIFTAIENDLHKQEQENSALLMNLVQDLGIEFDRDTVATLAYDGVVTGEMIAEAALMYDHEAKNPLLDPYREDGDRRDNPYVNFYWDFCSQGKPAYTPMQYISLHQAIDIIQTHQGVPILAHPGANLKDDQTILDRIIAEGVLGLEVYSSYHNFQQVQLYREAALSKDVLMTCGSDFHGKTKKSIKIGGSICDGQDEQIITRLMLMIEQLRS